MLTHDKAETRVTYVFWIHLAIYLLAVGGMAALNLSRSPDKLWVLWVAGGWGLGVVLHAVGFFVPKCRERMIERTIQRVDRREARMSR